MPYDLHTLATRAPQAAAHFATERRHQAQALALIAEGGRRWGAPAPFGTDGTLLAGGTSTAWPSAFRQRVHAEWRKAGAACDAGIAARPRYMHERTVLRLRALVLG